MSQQSHTISNILLQWYSTHQRELPWRNTTNPYLIWISEIILQQTRVNQGLDYYYRFVERFPDVHTLAKAEEDEVLKYWQGLGYYSRARNLHKAAKSIDSEYKGIFPENFDDVLKLSGVGIYTASAICSFAFNKPYAVVDGNVYRVLSRLFNIDIPIDIPAGQKIFQKLADEILDKENPAKHNQAIMEFGALQCVPVNPDCESCTLKSNCLSFANKNQSKLPVKSLKVKVKNRYFNFLHIKYQDFTFINQRNENDIWQKLWEFPLIEENTLLNPDELFQQEAFERLFEGIQEVKISSHSHPIKHILTHQRIMAQLFTIEINELNDALKQFKKIRINELDQYAVSRLMQLFLENHLT
jgi:A/G-specific adenine glycosylase